MAFKSEMNITEAEQLSSRQNGTQHSVGENLVATIEIHPSYPDAYMTQTEAVEYLKQKMSSLVDEGWDISVAIGQPHFNEDADYDSYCLFEHLDEAPAEVQAVVEEYMPRFENEDKYALCPVFLEAVEQVGYTFDWGLSGDPMFLRPKVD